MALEMPLPSLTIGRGPNLDRDNQRETENPPIVASMVRRRIPCSVGNRLSSFCKVKETLDRYAHFVHSHRRTLS